ncbi:MULTISPECIES: amino acid ABC transporter substrate-binding protein [Geobacter]|uniref:amino acid ABC transporter substrate-binding protein n=1 Tax=Geobacter TaxID=28231 RepID=UPI00257233DF|nr:amino acid ABC transporter substrate-binding protein [Geobacter sulfurreducens]BEH10621.1 ABC transporter substrate-binding protein [Geobacter sulfurreducens subsp. ethanolicus]BET57776.1 ABC transporter substrate-binding protein [Geobacter sp. 60473]
MICVTGKRLALSAVAMLLMLLCSAATGRAAAPTAALSPEEMRQGERMYREGVLPSGAPMKAFVSGDVPVDGTAFTCVSCHLHSGLGSFEGEVVTPPTNGRVLYQERKPFIPGSEFIPSVSNYAKNLPVRPAYTDETLASLIATGIDPTGRSVLYVMPRYELGDRDMAILIAYLKALSDKPSPGVGTSEIKFATVIVEGTNPLAVESMLTPIQFSVDRKNSLTLAAKKNSRVARMAYNMLGDLHSMSFTLSRWTLKGPPETWRAQLDQYYRNEPVFALLGGISEGEWEPVHRFCEENRIPNLFPVVDYPVISDTDWYTLYFSRGVRQEGEAAARYLNGMAGLFGNRPVVQVIRDSRKGEALADGFRTIWQQRGHAAPLDIRLTKGERLTDKLIREILDTRRPAALLVWDDDSALPALTGAAAGKEEQPTVLLASGTYLGKSLWSIPEPLRDRLYLTYPYRLPQEDVRFDIAVKKVLPGKDIQSFDQKIIRESFITGEVLGKALMEMRAEYYRDFLLDSIGMMTDMYYPLYERVSFGPGQRYASKGCYIVQLGKGESPKLERRSEWVIP